MVQLMQSSAGLADFEAGGMESGGGDSCEGEGTPVGCDALPPLPPSQGPPSIPLSLLLEFAVHKTYQELTVLSELLPKKADMDRKISIVKFAYDSRQLFIRMLALVKWLKTAGKVNDCTSRICYFVDETCGHLVDTADRLARLAREELIHARLPAFQIPAAVDVLCLGSYPRLPVAIRSRFVADAAILPREEAHVLARLNQVIQHRLLSAAAPPLPARVSEVAIRNGAVRLGVPGEFAAWLTILGEADTRQWNLLHLQIHVADDDIGDGAELVHPLQLHFLHNLLQARLDAAAQPVQELVRILHRFCLSLKLDLLFCQAKSLQQTRLGRHLSVDAYESGGRLLLGYWGGGSRERRPGIRYQLSVSVDGEALRVAHFPSASSGIDGALPRLQESGCGLSLEGLLMETTLVRAKERLRELGRRLDMEGSSAVELSGSVAPELAAALLQPAEAEEMLKIGLNLFTGAFVLELPELRDEPESAARLTEAQTTLNSADPHLPAVLASLRMCLYKARCRRGLAGLPVKLKTSMPGLSCSEMLSHLWPNRLYAQYLRFPEFFLIVTFRERSAGSVEMEYHLVQNAPLASSPSVARPVSVVLLDPACASLAYSRVADEPGRLVGSKSAPRPPDCLLAPKRSRLSLGQAGEVGRMGSVVEHRLPFYLLQEEMERLGIRYHLGRMDAVVGGAHVTVIALPTDSRLWADVVSCTVRLQLGLASPGQTDRKRCAWLVEIVFARHPFPASAGADGTATVVLNRAASPDGTRQVLEDLIANFDNFSRLHAPVQRFAKAYHSHMHEYVQVRKHAYFKTNIAYGPDLSYLMVLKWSAQEKAFHLSFATHGPNAQEGNPHTLMASLLSRSFNESEDLVALVETLAQTIRPLIALHSLSTELVQPRSGDAGPPSAGSLRLKWALIPIAPTHIRLLYRGQLGLELFLYAQGHVGVRDLSLGSGGLLNPVLGLKAFLVEAAEGFGLDETRLPAFAAAPLRSNRNPSGGESLWGPGSVGNPLNMLGSPAASSPANVHTPNPFIPPSPLGAHHPSSVPPPPSSGATQMAGPASVPPNLTSSPAAPLMTPSPAPATGATFGTPSPYPARIDAPSPATQPPSVGPPLHRRSFASAAPREHWVSSYRGIRITHDGLHNICRRAEGGCLLDLLLSSVFTLRQYEKGLAGSLEQDKKEGKPEERRDVSELELGPGQLGFSVPRRPSNPYRFHFEIQIPSAADVGLRLRVSTNSEAIGAERLALVERYFALRVAPLASHEALVSFIRILAINAPKTAAAFLQLMANELDERASEGRWAAALLHLVPHKAALPVRFHQTMSPGVSAFRFNKDASSALFFLKLTARPAAAASTARLILPLVLDVKANSLRLHLAGSPATELDASAAAPQLRQVADVLQRHSSGHPDESCVWPAVHDLIHNLN